MPPQAYRTTLGDTTNPDQLTPAAPLQRTSGSQVKIGDLQLAGHTDAALKAYQDSWAYDKPLTRLDPGNTNSSVTCRFLREFATALRLDEWIRPSRPPGQLSDTAKPSPSSTQQHRVFQADLSVSQVR